MDERRSNKAPQYKMRFYDFREHFILFFVCKKERNPNAVNT